MDFSTLPVKWLKSHGDDSRELESVKMRQFPIIWRSRVQLIHRLLSEQFPTINGSLVFFSVRFTSAPAVGPLFHLEHNYFSFDSGEMKEQCREIGK